MSSTPPPDTAAPPADGPRHPGVDGSTGWRMVAAAFVSMFVVFGVAYSFGVFFRPIAATFHSGTGATSLVFALTAFAYFTLGGVSGPAADRFGPRAVLAVGAAAMGAGLIATAFAPSLPVAYLTYGLGVGVGVACGYVPMLGVVGGWFERRRSAALGVAVSGIGFGTLALSPLAAMLINHLGWRHTDLVLGAASALALAGCAAVVRRPPVARRQGGFWPDRALLRRPDFGWLYSSGVLGSMALAIALVYLAPYAEHHGLSKVTAASLVGVVGGASTIGRLALGAVATRHGHLGVYRGCFAVMAASFLLWWAGGSTAVLFCFAVVFGVAYGGFIALSPVVTADLFGVASLGGLLGVLYTGAGFGSLVAPPAAGLLIESSGYRAAIVAAMVIAAGGFALLLPVGRPGRRQPGGRDGAAGRRGAQPTDPAGPATQAPGPAAAAAGGRSRTAPASSRPPGR